MEIGYLAEALIGMSARPVSLVVAAHKSDQIMGGQQQQTNRQRARTPMDHLAGGRLGTPDALHFDDDKALMMMQQDDYMMPQAVANSSSTKHSDTLPHELFAKLQEALALEPKYQPSLFLPTQSNVSSFSVLLIVFLLTSVNFLLHRKARSQLALATEPLTFFAVSKCGTS